MLWQVNSWKTLIRSFTLKIKFLKKVKINQNFRKFIINERFKNEEDNSLNKVRII